MSGALYTDRTGQTVQNESLDVAASLPSTIVYGQKDVTTAGTAVALGSSTALTSGVRIKANSDNTGVLYVGDSDVDSTNGFILAAGEELFVEVADLATVYLDAGTSGDSCSYIGG